MIKTKEKPFVTELEKFRVKKKLSQMDFAKSIGVVQSTVSKIEHGKVLPSFEFLKNLREVYNFNVNKLFKDGAFSPVKKNGKK